MTRSTDRGGVGETAVSGSAPSVVREPERPREQSAATSDRLEEIRRRVELMKWASHVDEELLARQPQSLAAQFWGEDVPWLLEREEKP